MKILRNILIGLVALAVLLVAGAYLLPSTVHVERTATVDAPPATVFALVNGFGRFNEWSPWYERDPAARYTLDGPDYGVGARLTWASDDPMVGSGSQQITASDPHSRVEVALDFGDQGLATSYFDVAPAEGGSSVTWGFDTELGYNPIDRYMGLMFDRWIGAEYEKGLASLKMLAESFPDADFGALDIERTEFAPVLTAQVAATGSTDPAAMAVSFRSAVEKLMTFAESEGLTPAGPLMAIHTDLGQGAAGFTVALPVDSPPGAGELSSIDPSVKLATVPGGPVLRVKHVGPYSTLAETYEGMGAYMEVYGLEAKMPVWEEYVSNPETTSEQDLITYIYFPL